MVENRFRAVHFTCTGATHERMGQPCQDASFSVMDKRYSMAVVCDGHGGLDYFRSDRGSRLATQIFAECVADKHFIRRLNKAESYAQLEQGIRQLLKSMILRWNEAVEADALLDPVTQEELENVSEKAKPCYEAGEKLQAIYGTTLLGFVCGKHWCFGVQIGDGCCVLANRHGQLSVPIAADEKCFLNVTTSLADENAFEEFRIWISDNTKADFPVAVFLGTDGIENSFAGDEKLLDFYRLVLKNIAACPKEDPIEELFGYLPTLSQKGSGDDISLGLLLGKEMDTWMTEAPSFTIPD